MGFMNDQTAQTAGYAICGFIGFILFIRIFAWMMTKRCAWCREKMPLIGGKFRGEYRGGYGQHEVIGQYECFTFCSLRCRNSFEASRGIKEIRQRTIWGE